MKRFKLFVRQMVQNRWWQHLLFWAFSFYALLHFFAYQSPFTYSDWVYTLLFHLSLFFVVYVNLRLLIPYMVRGQRYVSYGLSVVMLLLAGVFFNQWTFNVLSNWIFPQFYFISYYEPATLLYFMVAYWSLTTLLKFSKAWFTLIEARQRLQELESEKLKAELSGLKNQVNPHFLFNALNSIYGLAIDHHTKTPRAILKLSQVLRYMLYESNEPRVNLSKEVQHLEDYIDIQKMRLEDESLVQLEQKGDLEHRKIAPLLLLPFVENGFKHGLKGDIEGMFLHISLEVTPDRIRFKTKNNIGDVDETSPGSGIGLANVKRRLELLYPNRFELNIDKKSNVFEVELVIFEGAVTG